METTCSINYFRYRESGRAIRCHWHDGKVTEVDQAKGLEFDYVVLVDVGSEAYPATPSARPGCTSARPERCTSSGSRTPGSPTAER